MVKGILLKQLRKNKTSLSQTDAARLLGVSKQTLYKYENDIITNIPSDVIERIAKLYETTPAFLMGWEDEDGNKTPEGKAISAYNQQYERNAKIEKAMELFDQYDNLPDDKKIQFDNFLKFLQSDVEIPHLKKDTK